jgi:acetate kinase
MKILVANVGSTSFKYKLFEMAGEKILAEGRIERIGEAQSPCAHRIGNDSADGLQAIPDYPSAIADVMSRLAGAGIITESAGLDAVGFKTVHVRAEPGAYLLDEQILSRMADYNDLAPAHNPPYIQAIRIFRELYPELPLVGLFEPAFHATVPDYAYIYSVPYAWFEKHGVRKYGFHGASHRYVSERVPEMLGRPAEGLRIISCHLGGSSSLCAIRDGQSIDTSMGFSAQDGIINSTRNGSIDPFIIPFVMDREGLSTADIRRILTTESGLLGISGISGDMRDLEEAAEAGNDRARLSIEAFCYGVKKKIGAYTAALGGLDALAFAGGIGERGAAVRDRICSGLDCLGIRLDPARNLSGQAEGTISAESSPVQVLIVQTDEERVVARATAQLLS